MPQDVKLLMWLPHNDWNIYNNSLIYMIIISSYSGLVPQDIQSLPEPKMIWVHWHMPGPSESALDNGYNLYFMLWYLGLHHPLNPHWSLYARLQQCCLKTVARSPNATHKRNAQPIVAPMIVSFVTNEFAEYFSPFHIFDIETGPLLTKLKTSYLKISKVLYNNLLL